MNQPAFQDQLGPVNHCHVCGPDNPHGLRIKSRWDGEEAVCTWQPQPHHCSGTPDTVNGGILASLIDCHSIGLCIADAYRRAERPIGSRPYRWYVTRKLEVEYLKPAAIDQPLHLRARVETVEGRKTWVVCDLFSAQTLAVRGRVLGIAVDAPEAIL